MNSTDNDEMLSAALDRIEKRVAELPSTGMIDAEIFLSAIRSITTVTKDSIELALIYKKLFSERSKLCENIYAENCVLRGIVDNLMTQNICCSTH